MRVLAMLGAGLVFGCGGAGAVAERSTSSGRTTGVDTRLTAEIEPADSAWSQRIEPAQTQRAIELWSGRVVTHQDDAATWLRLAEAHHFAATVHAADEPTIIEHARAGLQAADRARALLSADAVPPLYWRTRNQSTLAAAEGYAQVLLVDDEVTRALQSCERLQPDYDHFGAVMLLARHGAHPIDPAQRDLPAARARFDRVLAVDSTFMPHHVAVAADYAIVAGDRALFERELVLVRDAAPSDLIDAEQAVAKTRALALLERMDDLFE